MVAMVFQWFPMVANHWSDDGMVTIHRSGLFLSVALIKVRTSQADVFIEIDHGVERMGLLVVDY